MSSLTTLVTFSLEDCNKCQYLPPLEQIPSLSLKPLKQTSTLQIEIANSSFAPLSKLEYLETGTLKEPLPNLSNLVSLGCRGPPPQEWQGLKSLQSLEIMREKQAKIGQRLLISQTWKGVYVGNKPTEMKNQMNHKRFAHNNCNLIKPIGWFKNSSTNHRCQQPDLMYCFDVNFRI
nr:hypothetical protein CFP56_25511 [Quercus suber]